MSKNKVVIGAFEPATLPNLGGTVCLAKVDTGAYYGSIHVDEVKVDPGGVAIAVLHGQIFRFNPDVVKQTRVKSASGHSSKRVVVYMPITVQGRTYQTWVGLTSRSNMKFPMLLGRHFLRENNVLVDVALNSAYDTDGKRGKRL